MLTYNNNKDNNMKTLSALSQSSPDFAQSTLSMCLTKKVPALK